MVDLDELRERIENYMAENPEKSMARLARGCGVNYPVFRYFLVTRGATPTAENTARMIAFFMPELGWTTHPQNSTYVYNTATREVLTAERLYHRFMAEPQTTAA